MAMTGLEIFKLLPKDNCKRCGMPTCLAFAMQLAQKRAKLEACPCVSEEAKKALEAASAPPVRLITFGQGDNRVQVGQETVLFRHEEKFYNPTAVAVTVSDALSEQALQDRLTAIKALQFERVGVHIGVRAIAVVNDSKKSDAFAAAVSAVMKESRLALILCSESPDAMAAAAAKAAQVRPLLASATMQTAEAMAKIAQDCKCPLVAQSSSLEEAADLTEKIKALGVEDIVLSFRGISQAEQMRALTRARVLSLKKVFRPLGYPFLSFATEGDASCQTAFAASLICKYGSIVIVETVEPYALLPILTTAMNIYTDPQKPLQVEAKAYSIGETNKTSPVIFTTNFSLTYYTVESDVEASRVPCYILVVDTEGTSVLTAYSGDKLNEKAVVDIIKKTGIEQQVEHRKLIIPGYVAVMSGKLEEASGWKVMVGPRESSMLPKYLREVWN